MISLQYCWGQTALQVSGGLAASTICKLLCSSPERTTAVHAKQPGTARRKQPWWSGHPEMQVQLPALPHNASCSLLGKVMQLSALQAITFPEDSSWESVGHAETVIVRPSCPYICDAPPWQLLPLLCNGLTKWPRLAGTCLEQSQPQHVAQDIVQSDLEYLWRQGLHNFSRRPTWVLNRNPVNKNPC